MPYKAPEIEYLERAVEHVKKSLIPEAGKAPRDESDDEESEANTDQEREQ